MSFTVGIHGRVFYLCPTMSHRLYPLKLQPVYKDYLWGGQRMVQKFARDTDIRPIAESWEVSVHPDGMSVIDNGALAGRTLADVVHEYGDDLLGCGRGLRVFPLLMKVIDADRSLSLQVHPDDAGAATHGGEAKTEMWYVLDAEPGAGVYAAFGCR